MTPDLAQSVEPSPEERVGPLARSSPPLRCCPICAEPIRAADPVCDHCAAQMDSVTRKELRRSWHKLRSLPEAGWRLQAFGDYARDELRLSLAARGAQKW